ncbi:MAG: helix-hairpin-helix domain-containing protein [bacterium]|nr:helix-hairpin-helix domain-containing protein [bacterium]
MKLLSRATALFSLFFPLLVFSADSCININTAPEEELERIKHIGQARAEQIISLREDKLFSSLDELDRVIGIGPSRVSDIKKQGLACISGKSAPDSEPQQKEQLATTVPDAETASEENLAETKPQKPLNSLTLFSTALIIAIFSGFAILLLKRKAKNI